MEKRIQSINGDTVLEITEAKPVKVALSEKALLRQKEYFEKAIAKFQAGLQTVNANLDLIYAERNKPQ